MNNDNILLDYVYEIGKQRVEMLDKIDNTGSNVIVRLRNEAAEKGIELTLDEIKDLIKFIKEALI